MAEQYHDEAVREDVRADVGQEQDSGRMPPDDRQSRRGPEEGNAQRRRNRHPWLYGLAAIVALIIIGGGIWWYISTAGEVSTDDAFTNGNVVALAPQVSGRVETLAVTDNEFVKAGQLILQIDPRAFQDRVVQAEGSLALAQGQLTAAQANLAQIKAAAPARLQAAQAQLAQAQATLANDKANYDRLTSLPHAATTQQAIDNARAAYKNAQAAVSRAQAAVAEADVVKQQIAQAEAQVEQLQGKVRQEKGALAQAKLELSYTELRAPVAGWVTKRNVDKGSYVTAGQEVMNLVEPDVWVTANFKETQLTDMRPGQKVKISVDAYPDLNLTGRVQSIQMGSGEKFSAFPPENATGNFVKIVQRVPVKIAITGGLKPGMALPLGLSVTPTVMTGQGSDTSTAPPPAHGSGH